MAQPQPLAYAPHRSPTRRWAGRLAVGLTAVILLIWFGDRAYDWGCERWRLIQMQQECASFSPDASIVVYSDYPRVRAVGTESPYNTVFFDDSGDTRWYGRGCPTFDSLAGRYSSSAAGHALLFLHERTTRSGERRIVAITLDTQQPLHESGAIASACVMTEAPFLGNSQPRCLVSGNIALGIKPADDVIEFYAGQPDPADPARFTIAYTVDRQPGTIEGRLNDGLWVSLYVATGPLAKPTTRDSR